ncbi:MAG: ABC transporter ATP-binding protein [Hamadaea sp.]|uniref:ABC transporter ATP-binding protein n=1 Tax=Hamadaea sp. TaxID=2024425 RepID=UPI0017D29815|nr:ABC transporter ATP-binding protein [Hamadaea sp.]NUR69662.1 ABC transporter ATP-binding protein [Hamadaea sp.]NUT19529.1 ABC transporter ATP-binding protein [Hamadaea sp.]
MIEALAASWRILVTAWRLDRRRAAAAVALMLGGAAAAPLMAYALGRMTDALADRDGTAAAVAGGIAGALAIAMLTFSHFAHIAYFELAEMAEEDFDAQLMEVSNGTPGIEHHEQPEQADAITILRQEGRQFENAMDALMNGVGLVVAMAITAVLLARVDPLLLLLPVAALPPLIAGRRAERFRDRARTRTAEPTRVALNLVHLSTSVTVAGELRVFRLGRELLDRHRRNWAAATKGLARGHFLATMVHTAGQLVFALSYVAAVLLVVRQAIAGHGAIGDVVLVIVLAVQVNQQVTLAVSLMETLQRMGSAYQRLRTLREQVTPPALTGPRHDPPPRFGRGITLRDVSFRYPGAKRAALRDVTLTLPAGSRVAIVGENGAGKTTLVKLLCGFYPLSSGQILVDDVDLAGVPVQTWRQRISVGFQDFARYEFDARHTVGVGDLPNLASDEHVLDALDRAQAIPVIDHLPDGLGSQLGRSWTDGAELSGGQWQRLALGRAMMRRQPLLLVLDEPASALDPAAEHALFERYADQAGRVARESGAITVFVSHRFSTVRMADLIVVLNDGVIAEVGDHATLMANRGLYAELFDLQARAYS